MIPGTSGNSYEIVQAPGYVAIRYERMNDVRVIPLDGRPHATFEFAHIWATRAVGLRAIRRLSRRRTSETRAPTEMPIPIDFAW
jgi:hypothetical protein